MSTATRIRRTRMGVLLLVTAVLLLALASFQPVFAAASGGTISLTSVTHDAGPPATTTYTWTLTGGSSSHVVINTCLGNTAVATGGSPDATGVFTVSDPTTGNAGYKWETGQDLPDGATFSLTFAGTYDSSGTSTWVNKKGSTPSAYPRGTTGGPNCTVTTSTTTTTEAPPDCDEDGVPDAEDEDDGNDCTPTTTTTEAPPDCDEDGVPDAEDEDDGNDCTPTTTTTVTTEPPTTTTEAPEETTTTEAPEETTTTQAPTTTTTEPATTTTEAPEETTTTQAPPPSTTLPPTTAPPTTAPPTTAPSTTLPPTTTTEAIVTTTTFPDEVLPTIITRPDVDLNPSQPAVQPKVLGETVNQAEGSGVLPFTGTDPIGLFAIAGLMMGFGVALLVSARLMGSRVTR